MPENTSTGPSTAFVLPGQGGFDGAALRLAKQKYPQVQRVFERLDAETDALFSRRISDVLFGPDHTDLRGLLADDSWVSQVAIYGAGLAAYEILTDQGVRPDVLAGHSLGEITALVAAGAFSAGDGVRIVAQRVAVIERHDGIDGRMVALSAGADRVRMLLGLLDDPLLAVATENHDEQTVVSGPDGVLDQVTAIAAQLNIAAIGIDAPFPFHTPALAPAAPEFEAYVSTLDQHPLQRPVYSPILQRYYEPDEALAGRLADHFVQPVRFAAAVRRLHGEGVSTFVEAGGRPALSKLVTRLTQGSDVRSLATLALDDGDRLALDVTLRELRDAGLADADGPSGPGLAELLAPTVPSHLFEEYWKAHGHEVRERIRTDVEVFGEQERARSAVTPDQDTSPQEAGATGAAPNAALDRDEVFAELRTLYAQALEYPEEVFEAGVQLEAELGVDSVKQVELLSRVSKRYGLPPREDDFRLAPYNTLDAIAGFVIAELERLPDPEPVG
ncbi:acyltransferase domain-containing protein [Streptomyces sp. S.PB5]|uniref:acyltransferase domain-containing protein n=1 Tax=Streptomyces sp. S.PB5 TaxID=3020844 RepID=UPI0025B27F43|nr:acyltransferase domain-containing protein [Streptomyces sp. S.PB5]MDN3028374.1 acyltransferase domain-containing protein [Streptomyces sp. S.PB5]